MPPRTLTIVVVLLVLFGSISPLGAQNNTSPCTAEQHQQLIDTFNLVQADIDKVINVPEPEEMEMGDLYIMILSVDWLLDNYRGTFHDQMPECADALFIGESLGLVYDSFIQVVILTTLSLRALDAGNVDAGDQLIDAAGLRNDYTQTLPELPEIFPQLEQGNMFPDGLPVCGAAAGDVLIQYETPFQSYLSILPEYEHFIETGSGDFDTLLQFETLSLETLQMDTEVCAESYYFEVLYNRLFMDTSIVIHVLQLAALEERFGEATNAELYHSIAEERKASVEELLPMFMPPE